MAKGDIEISIDANASGAIKGFKQTETAAQRAGNVVNKGAKIAAVGFAAVGVGALALAKGAADDQKAATALATTLKNTTGATKAQVAATEAWISKQGQLTGITDDELRPALSKLVASTHDVGKAQELAKLAMDVSAGSGKDLQTVSAALAKAQNGNVGALSRLGIKTKESVKDNAALQAAQIRVRDSQDKYNQAVEKFGPKSKEAHLAAAKLEYAQTKLGEAQGKVKTSTIDAKEAMKRLADTYGGSAGKQAETLAGKTKILQTQLSEAGETIGYALIPVLTTLANFAVQKVLPALTSVGNWLSDHKPVAIALGVAVATVGAAFIAASIAMKIFTVGSTLATASAWLFSAGATKAGEASRAWTAIQWALNASVLGFPLVWIVAAIAAVIVAAILIVKNWDKIKAALAATWDAIKVAFSKAWDAIKAAAAAVWQAIKNVVSAGLAVIKGWFMNWTGPGLLIKHWEAIKSGAGNAVDWVKNKFSNLMDFFRGLPGKIGSIFSGLWHGVADGLKSALNSVLHLPLKIPVIDTHIPGVGKVGGQTLIPALAKGGIVRARPGGTLVLAGEGGRDEAVVPLDEQHRFGGGLTIENLTINAAPNEPINSSLPRAIAALDLLYGAA